MSSEKDKSLQEIELLQEIERIKSLQGVVIGNVEGRKMNVTLKHYANTTKLMLYREDYEIFERIENPNYRLSVADYIAQGEKEFLKSIGRDIEDKTEYLRQQKSKIFNRIYDLVSCNDFDYFATFTISPNAFGVDRNDLESVKKRMRKMFNKYNELYKTKLRYIATFEEHKKGGWHLHALISGIDSKHFRHAIDFKTKELMYDINNDNHSIYNCSYFDKLGWNTFKKTYGEKRNVAIYLTKYITKDLNIENFNYKAKYMRSRNLKKPEKESSLYTDEELRYLKDNFMFFQNNFFEILELPKRVEEKELRVLIKEKIEESKQECIDLVYSLFDSSIIEIIED